MDAVPCGRRPVIGAVLDAVLAGPTGMTLCLEESWRAAMTRRALLAGICNAEGGELRVRLGRIDCSAPQTELLWTAGPPIALCCAVLCCLLEIRGVANSYRWVGCVCSLPVV